MHNDVGEIKRWKMKKICHKKDKVNMAIGVIERRDIIAKKTFFMIKIIEFTQTDQKNQATELRSTIKLK